MRRGRRLAWGLAAGAGAAFLALCTPVAARATISGDCTASASTASSSVDITTEAVWHVRSGEVMVGEGNSNAPQTHVTVKIASFGVGVATVIDSSGGGNDHGSGGPYKVDDYSRFARVFAIHGSSNDCTGDLIVVVDDVGVLSTVAGAVSAGLTGVGLLGLILALFVRGPVGGRVLGFLAGFFGGLGLAEFLQQLDWISPTSLRDLAIPVVTAIAGVLLAGLCAPSPSPADVLARVP